MKKYSESHEWIELEGNVGTVGVTDYAQKELGDIVYVELPKVDREVTKGNEVVVLESTKAAADVYTPVSGKILAVNTELLTEAQKVNQSPENEGWLFKIELTDPEELSGLMSLEEYHNQFK
jgi:glycine cleavage system H protein